MASLLGVAPAAEVVEGLLLADQPFAKRHHQHRAAQHLCLAPLLRDLAPDRIIADAPLIDDALDHGERDLHRQHQQADRQEADQERAPEQAAEPPRGAGQGSAGAVRKGRVLVAHKLPLSCASLAAATGWARIAAPLWQPQGESKAILLMLGKPGARRILAAGTAMRQEVHNGRRAQ